MRSPVPRCISKHETGLKTMPLLNAHRLKAVPLKNQGLVVAAAGAAAAAAGAEPASFGVDR